MKRGLLLGLDGLDFDFLEANRQSLPALDRLLSSGTWGRLRSTIPPATSAAWTAGLSGMSPGRTGISDFETEEDGVNEIVNSTDVRVPRLWDVVRENSGTTATIGVPVTYPVPSNRGAMISGFLSEPNGNNVWPAELEGEIPDDYEFFVSHDEGDDRDDVLDNIYSSTDAKFDLLERVVTEGVPGAKEPDFVTFVLSEPDWIQHYARRQPTDPGYEKGESAVLEYLQHVDRRVGELLELMDDDWLVASMSDHGFGKHTSHYVNVNEWLSRRGQLVLSGGASSSVRQAIGRNLGKILRVPGVHFVKKFVPNTVRESVAEAQTLSDDEVDWSETTAHFDRIFANCGAIHLDDPPVADVEALTDALLDGLESLTDPVTGEPVVESAHRREEYYDGPNVDTLPEIVFVFREPYSGHELVGSDDIVRELPAAERPPVHHKMDGYFSVTGPGIASDRRRDANIYDIAPTVYRALGVPVPEQTDGEVIDAFTDEGLKQGETKSYTFGPVGTEERAGEETRKRLEELGYL